ncbi:MAG: nitroreductase family protein [Oscillospiraceae bacterium]|nr:nitroreductase family protein [Oscillospiraceae bacterium]
MSILSVFKQRRSVRQYTGEAIPQELLEQVLKAGLTSASGRARRPWEFIVIRDPDMLAKMAKCRAGGAQMLEGANAAIVVIADPNKTDVWVEDASIAMANMHLMADSLGIGSCWIQGRLREAGDGRSTETYLRELLSYPDSYRLLAILSLGMPQSHAPAYEDSDLPMEKIHYEKF